MADTSYSTDQILNQVLNDPDDRLRVEVTSTESAYHAFTASGQTVFTVVTGWSLRETGGVMSGIVLIRDGAAGGPIVGIMRCASGAAETRSLPDVSVPGGAYLDAVNGQVVGAICGRA